MKDITILIPIADISTKTIDMLENAIENVNSLEYEGGIFVYVIKPSGYDNPTIKGWNSERDKFIDNPYETDYCSQINFGVKQVETEYFAILEVDDKFNHKWFKMFNEYSNNNDYDVSIFLPINVLHNLKTNEREFVNDMVWSASFSNEIGYIDLDCLQDSASFNLTGGIFKTENWLEYKPSIKVAFNYEYLLRATNKNQKVFVIPKEGYYHNIFGEGSLSEMYVNTINDNDVSKWFELAKREYKFDNDRQKDIINTKEDVLR